MFESALKILRVGKGASPEVLREAYVKMVRRYPPEHFPEKFIAIKRAYDQLTAADSILQEFLNPRALEGTAAELAGLLWGALTEFREESIEIDFTELISLIDAPSRKNTLSAALDLAAADGIYLMESEADLD